MPGRWTVTSLPRESYNKLEIYRSAAKENCKESEDEPGPAGPYSCKRNSVCVSPHAHSSISTGPTDWRSPITWMPSIQNEKTTCHGEPSIFSFSDSVLPFGAMLFLIQYYSDGGKESTRKQNENQWLQSLGVYEFLFLLPFSFITPTTSFLSFFFLTSEMLQA